MGSALAHWRIAALAILLALHSGSQTADAVPFSLSTNARSGSVRAGNPVWIDVKMENKSKHRIAVYRAISEDMDQGGWVYLVDVRDEDGKSPAQTEYARRIGHGGDGGYIPLNPGEVLTEGINVSKLYDLGRARTYLIQVQRFDDETKGFVKSNEIRVVATR
jgi:hypothetical protein